VKMCAGCVLVMRFTGFGGICNHLQRVCLHHLRNCTCCGEFLFRRVSARSHPLYWETGSRIRRGIFEEARAEFGSTHSTERSLGCRRHRDYYQTITRRRSAADAPGRKGISRFQETRKICFRTPERIFRGRAIGGN
jgi:hypothetical protein